jgi:hypothetical protein
MSAVSTPAVIALSGFASVFFDFFLDDPPPVRLRFDEL